MSDYAAPHPDAGAHDAAHRTHAQHDAAAVPKSARTWAMLCHVSAVLGNMMPFANLFAPLVIWLIKRDDHPFIDDQGKEAINFQITVTIALAVSAALMVVGIGFVLLPVVWLAAMILIVIATVKSNSGEQYRYPLTLRLVN